ncbi:MAG: hypothetical protein PHU06_10345 [Gallionella sp.]|nr:hypothetical protein [Gallionella sp.]MDD4960271.1 hypothetical protein [Gallionella sp.]
MNKLASVSLAVLMCSLGAPVYAADDSSTAAPVAPHTSVDPADPAQPPAIPPEKVTFLDSRIFDIELFKYLDAGKESVEISIAGHISLSAIPPRLDRWIAKSAEGGGKVEILPMPATRMLIFSLISMAFSSMGIWEKFREESAYEKAKKYDVKIFYKKDSTGDTLVEKIVMNKRKL